MIKKVCRAAYAHKTNIQELLEKEVPNELHVEFMQLVNAVANQYVFDIIKYELGDVSFIESPDWDVANEPTVGMSYKFKKDNWVGIQGELVLTPTIRKNGKQIYHNKWQFVADDYVGFDVEKAKQRTVLWNSIPDIKNVKSKIGYRSFWDELLLENNIPR